MRKLALIGALVLAMFAMACSSSDDDSSDGDSNESTATATTEGGSSGGEATETATATESSGGSEGGNPLEVLSLFGDAEYQVTYNTEGSSAEGDLSGAMTIFQKGDSQRVDLMTEQDGEAFDVTTINTPEGTVFCILSEQTCLSSSIGGADPSAFATGFLDDVRDEDPEVDLNPIGQRTIAGTTAECFEATDPDGSGTTCISPEGVPLLVDFQGTDGSTWKMEATEYSTSVSDGDFEPPFEVTSFGF